MRKSIAVIVGIIFMLAGLSYAEDISQKKSMKALRMDGYDQDHYETLEIQLDVGKVYLKEVEKTPAPVPSSKDKERGYIIFLRNYLFDVLPFTNPTRKETREKEIKVFTTPDEYEPITFSIYPLTDLKNCKISASDFVNKEGNKLPQDSFQINNVICRPLGSGIDIFVKGEILERAKEIPEIYKGVCKRIWINVKVAEDTSPGDYKGKITFAPSNKPASDISVTVKVLPFKLIQPPDMTWAPIMAGTWDFERLEKELIAIKEHGMTGEVTNALRPEGNDFSKANRYMEIAKKVGLQGQFVLHNFHIRGPGRGYPREYITRKFSRSSIEGLKDMAIKTRDNAKRNNWLPYMLYLTTELGNAAMFSEGLFMEVMRSAERYYDTMRKVKGIKLLATFNRKQELEMHWDLPEIDAIGFNGPMFPEWEKASKKKESWMTFIGGGVGDRCGHGFYLWKFNLKGVRPWALTSMGGLAPGLLYYYDKECHPSVRFERIREGVDDYKYLYTLSQYIKKANEKGEHASSARATIKSIIAKIPHDHWDPPGFDISKLDKYRWQLAEKILKLLK